jgi:membrane-associated phospholipid phosphatase
MLRKISSAFTLCLLIFCVPKTRAYAPLRHLGAGTRGAFHGTNRWIWIGGSGLTLLAFKYDKDIYKHYSGKEKEEMPDSVGDIMGTGLPGAAIAIGTLATGWLTGNPRTVEAGSSHAEALLATFFYTSVLKVVVERDRPPAFSKNESAFNASFPSGHTSAAFATAGSLMASGGPAVGVPALALAALTGYSRIQQRAHFTGDVLFGAILGYTMGTGFYEHHRAEKPAGWNLRPYFENRDSFGVSASFSF